MTPQSLKLSMGAVSGVMVDLNHARVAQCDTEQAAMRLCIQESRIKWDHRALAEQLGMTGGSLNTIINSDYHARNRYLSRVMQIELQRLCGNRAIDQWADLYARGMLRCQKGKTEEIKQLRSRLRELEQ